MSNSEEISFEKLLEALLDVDQPFPARLLYRLSDLESEELSLLEKTWEEIPAWRRKALMEDVEALGERDYVLSFEKLALFALQDEDPAVRLPALRTLWEFENPDLVEIFLRSIEEDVDPEVRAAAATALGRFVYMGELEEIPAELQQKIEDNLLSIITGNEPELLSRRALEALGYSSREEVPPLIETAYNSGNQNWLVSALYAMGRSANERWRPLVLSELESPLVSVRAEAARAAGELEMREAVPLLLDLLNDEDVDVRAAAIWSLSQTGGPGVQEVLEALYEETEDDEEAEFIESALDNLAFTEDIQIFSLFDFGEGEQDDADEMLFDLDEDDEDQVE